MTESSIAGGSKIRALLCHRPFMRYMVGGAISMTGTWMQVMAQALVMTTLTDSAFMFGLVNFASGFPMVVLSMMGGVFADRFDKRRILVTTQVVQILLALLLGTLVASGSIRIWHVIAVAFVIGISNSFEMPADTALVPELVGREHVATAIAIDRSVFHGTRLIGPAAAGYITGVWGTASAFFLNAVSFVAMIAAVVSLRPRPQGTAEEERQRQTGIRDGISYVRSDAPTLAMIGLMAATTFFVFPVLVVMVPLYVKHILHLGGKSMGLLMGISASGSLMGSIGLLAVRRERRRSLLFAGVVGAGCALLSLSVAQSFTQAAMTLVILSLSVSGLIGLANTIVQERAPGPLRGRVSAIASLSFFGLMPFAGLGITQVADVFGMRQTLSAAGFIYLAVALLVLMSLGRRITERPLAVARTLVGSQN